MLEFGPPYDWDLYDSSRGKYKQVHSAVGRAYPTMVQSQGKFVCPTTSAGCASYDELLEAKDHNVADENVRYACFREYADEFFIITLRSPSVYPWYWYKWSRTQADYVFNDNAQSTSWLEIDTFEHGVGDDSHVPHLFAQGTWRQLSGQLRYYGNANRWDAKLKKSTADPDSYVIVDDAQIQYINNYTAQSGKKVQYSLALQRSTRRFTERFNVVGNPKESSEETGRCAEVRDMPKMPDPPELTQDQQDEQQALRDKMEYCASPTRPPSDDGYCASTYIYSEEYEASRKKQGKKSPSTGKQN